MWSVSSYFTTRLPPVTLCDVSPDVMGEWLMVPPSRVISLYSLSLIRKARALIIFGSGLPLSSLNSGAKSPTPVFGSYRSTRQIRLTCITRPPFPSPSLVLNICGDPCEHGNVRLLSLIALGLSHSVG